MAKMDDMGCIWKSNERQRRTVKSLKKKGVRQISSYQRELNKLNQVVDETMMQIKKNIQKDKVDRDRLTAMSRTTKK